jgi:hypothetical protein
MLLNGGKNDGRLSPGQLAGGLVSGTIKQYQIIIYLHERRFRFKNGNTLRDEDSVVNCARPAIDRDPTRWFLIVLDISSISTRAAGAVQFGCLAVATCAPYFESTTMSTANLNADDDQIIAATENWLEKAVIGLNLCPFAKAVHVKKQVRYVVSNATTPEALLEQLMEELQRLSDTDPEEVDTTLLIHPFVLTDFLDYNEFLDVADAAVEDMQLDGEIQVASFHPQYQFADTDVNDIANYTNRAPYPILHLLREESIDRAVDAFPEAEQIFEKNVETMNNLGHDGWDKLDVGPAR